MIQFNIENLNKIQSFLNQGTMSRTFNEIEDFYNSFFGTNYHSNCAPCSKSRYIEALKAWRDQCLKWKDKQIKKEETWLRDFEGVPLGLSYRQMDGKQKKVYSLWSESKKAEYKELSSRTKGKLILIASWPKNEICPESVSNDSDDED